MAQNLLSTEESTIFEIMKILREDSKVSLDDMAFLENTARLIRHADHKTRIRFDHIFATIQAAQRSTRLRTSGSPEHQALCSDFAAIEILTRSDTYAGACKYAAKLIAEAWIDYPRTGTEQLYIYIEASNEAKEQLAATIPLPRLTAKQRRISLPRPKDQRAVHSGNRTRLLVCNDSFQCAAILVQKLEAAPRTIQNQRLITTLTHFKRIPRVPRLGHSGCSYSNLGPTTLYTLRELLNWIQDSNLVR